MIFLNKYTFRQSAVFTLALVLTSSNVSGQRLTPVDQAKHQASLKVSEVINPLLAKYCNEQCKVLGVDVELDLLIPHEIAPGFDEISAATSAKLAPVSANVKLLVDEMIGPISRQKLLDLINEHFTAFPYPVKIETKITHFPQPASAARQVAELRRKISKKFQENIKELFEKFCPEQCLLADFSLRTSLVNPEEVQYGASSEFVQEGDVALKINDVTSTILMDDILTAEERANIVEMARLKTSYLSNVNLKGRAMQFPNPFGTGRGRRGLASEDSKSTKEKNAETKESTEANKKNERFEKYEKIERVEQGSQVQKQLKTFKTYGIIFALAVLALLVFLAMGFQKSKQGHTFTLNPFKRGEEGGEGAKKETAGEAQDRNKDLSKRYEIDNLLEELTKIFAENPKVAKQVFTRVLTEDGVERTAHYIELFGESVVLDLLRDPSLHADFTELMDFYSKNIIDLEDDDKLELLRSLHNRTVAAKMFVFGNRSLNLFDFLVEMDGTQIMELINNESITVKAIIMTQCDPEKRSKIYSQLDDQTKMKLYSELSRIDYLPRDYIFNVANALKRKRVENPKLNTEVLPGSDVLVNLLERTSQDTQRSVIQSLVNTNPESARLVKGKLISVDTLMYLRDNHLLEVVLGLKHEELLNFLRGAPGYLKDTIYSKCPAELVAELEEEIATAKESGREGYSNVARKILNRIKIMANDGVVNLTETNERMFGEDEMMEDIDVVEAGPGQASTSTSNNFGISEVVTQDQTLLSEVQAEEIDTPDLQEGNELGIKKVAGW
jgi:hypothetical protein